MARRNRGTEWAASAAVMWATLGVASCGGGGGSGGGDAAAAGADGVAADAAQAPAAPAPARPTTSNAPPVISGTPATRVQADADYEFRPVASDPDADPLRFSAINLPSWASLDGATGRLHGRPQPNDKGVYGPITLTVTDRPAHRRTARL